MLPVRSFLFLQCLRSWRHSVWYSLNTLSRLNYTFGTHLSKNSVASRTTQAILRHSSLDLTMNVYTDPSLLDVAEALGALPELITGSAVRREPVSRRLKPVKSPGDRVR